MINTGIQNIIISSVEKFVQENDQYNVSWLAYDDNDDELLGVATIKFAETVPCWYSKFSFTTNVGRERYGVSRLFVETFENGFKVAAEKNYYEAYFSIRFGRFRLIEQLLKESEILKDFKVEVVENIPAHSHSINPLVKNFIHGPASGQNPKPLVVIRIYNPEKVNYVYPYPQQN